MVVVCAHRHRGDLAALKSNPPNLAWITVAVITGISLAMFATWRSIPERRRALVGISQRCFNLTEKWPKLQWNSGYHRAILCPL